MRSVNRKRLAMMKRQLFTIKNGFLYSMRGQINFTPKRFYASIHVILLYLRLNVLNIASH